MRLVICSSLLLGFLAADLNANSVDSLASSAGTNSIHYSFTLSGFDLLQYQVLDLKFNASVYQSLSNAVAPATIKTTILQPDNPGAIPGDFLVEALISNPVLTPGSLGINATLTGSGALGPLPFSIDQFDNQDHFLYVVTSGLAVIEDAAPIPEPAGVSLPGLGLLIASILGSRWRHRDNLRNQRML
jgi:hypothetical protein